MHLNLKGNAATTKNEHNIVLGKPHLHQNQQRRTLRAPHQSSQLANTRPKTTTDRRRLSRAQRPTAHRHTRPNTTHTPTTRGHPTRTHPNNKGTSNKNTPQQQGDIQQGHTPTIRGLPTRQGHLRPVLQTTTLH
ncbi:hypothetical protein Taro_053153, partial [Colocasia esculenta]|nr:hypothetical protein [Colocasia esculenta]